MAKEGEGEEEEKEKKISGQGATLSLDSRGEVQPRELSLMPPTVLSIHPLELPLGLSQGEPPHPVAFSLSFHSGSQLLKSFPTSIPPRKPFLPPSSHFRPPSSPPPHYHIS